MRRLVRSSAALFGVVFLLASADLASAATDAQIAQQGVFVASDFPAGWLPAARDDDDRESLKIAGKIPTCKGYVAFEKANNATTSAASPDFESGSNAMHNDSYVHRDEAAATKVMKSLGAPKTVAKCLTAMLEKALDEQFSDDKNVKRTRALIKASGTDRSLGVETITFSGGFQIVYRDGSSEGQLIALLATRAGRVINTYSAFADPNDDDEVLAVLDGAVAQSLGRTVAALTGQ